MALPFPSFYDPAQVDELFVERGDLVAAEARAFRKRRRIRLARNDSFKVAAFGIDCQVSFCMPEASLFVPGAVEDTRRTIEWLYGNLNSISSLFFSLDTHRLFQIFHPAWWVNAKGEHPQPFTPISAKEIREGHWKTADVKERKRSLMYCEALEASGKYMLTIWPYHTLLGGVSHSLMPALNEAAIFHSIARREEIQLEIKGHHPSTENYSVFSPEVQKLDGQKIGSFNTDFADKLLSYDRIYVFGQASSHCVMSTLDDLLQYILAKDPALVDKVWILEDAMSPVSPPPIKPLPAALNFPAIAKKALRRFAKAGMHITTTDKAIVE